MAGAVSVAAGAGFAASAAVGATRHQGFLAALGGAAAALLALALATGRTGGILCALVGLGAEYAAALRLSGGDVNLRAPFLAALLLVVGELAYWSLELRAPVRDEPGIRARRAGLILALGMSAVAAGTLLVAVSWTPVRGGLALQTAGVACAIALVEAVIWLAGRASPGPGPSTAVVRERRGERRRSQAQKGSGR